MMQRSLSAVFACLLIVFSNLWPTVQNAKILGLFAHQSESNFAVMRTMMTELAKREHQVTVISSHRLNEQIDNLKEIIVEPEYQFWRELQKVAGVRNGLHELSQLADATLQRYLAQVGAASTAYFLANERVQQILRMPADVFDYDLIIIDLFHTEALLMFGELFNKPSIAVVSSNFEGYMNRVLESVVPVACSPIDFASYSKDIGFWKRLTNIRHCMNRRRQFVRGNLAAQQTVMENYFGQHYKGALPTIAELQSKLALLLVNNHVPLAQPRPLLPNTIAAGGLHVRRPRELPWHIRRFLDEARNGAIYVNLGNELLCRDIPKDTLAMLLKVFGQSKQCIIWSCHDDMEQVDAMPKNILIQHMVPQTDIMAHPMIKLFVMNGDLLSLQEGILRHVPMLGIPIFREEHENMDHAVSLGVGLKLSYDNLTETSFTWALQAALQDASYPLTIRDVGAVFRNRPLGALETSIYWVDYVLRYNGASHIRALGVGIASSQLHLFDLFIYYFGMALVIVGVCVCLVYVANILWKRHQVEKIYSKLS